MTCTRIDLSAPPYDEASVTSAYLAGGCNAVAAHFQAVGISPGDCVEIDGEPYRIAGVSVKCEGNTVFTNGAGPNPPDHVKTYQGSPVSVELWLTPMSEEEFQACL